MFCALLYACNCRLFEIKLFKMARETIQQMITTKMSSRFMVPFIASVSFVIPS
jgi:hypothetical protein